jgi:glutamate racemase
VIWLDPAPAIARRVAAVLEGREVPRGEPSFAMFTSGRSQPAALRMLLARSGVPLREASPAEAPARI